jgi:hypothetical protein
MAGCQSLLYLVLSLLIDKGPPPLPRVGVEGSNTSSFTISEAYETVAPWVLSWPCNTDQLLLNRHP